jgi:hypothetical protein
MIPSKKQISCDVAVIGVIRVAIADALDRHVIVARAVVRGGK